MEGRRTKQEIEKEFNSSHLSRNPTLYQIAFLMQPTTEMSMFAQFQPSPTGQQVSDDIGFYPLGRRRSLKFAENQVDETFCFPQACSLPLTSKKEKSVYLILFFVPRFILCYFLSGLFAFSKQVFSSTVLVYIPAL